MTLDGYNTGDVLTIGIAIGLSIACIIQLALDYLNKKK